MDKSSKHNRVSPMSAAFEAKEMLKAIAEPITLGENLKSILPRIARRCGLPERRIKGIWHNEARAIRSDELAALKAAASKPKALPNENISDRLLRVEQRLAAIDPDFYREHMAVLRDLAGRNRDNDD